MPEDRDAGVAAALCLIMRGSKREVVVLQAGPRAVYVHHFFQQGVGKLPVHVLVVLPILGAERRTRVGDVAERPQTLVREAVVVALFFLFRSQTRRSV